MLTTAPFICPCCSPAWTTYEKGGQIACLWSSSVPKAIRSRWFPFCGRRSPICARERGSARRCSLRLCLRKPRDRVFYALCALTLGLVALSLTAFGLYSMLSYIVSQRRREIGIRMALGAGRGQVVRLVVWQGGALVAGGLLLGLLAASAVGRIIESLLFGVGAFDPLTFTVVTAVLVSVGLLACWFPASRAARVDPMDVLRDA